MTSPSIQESLNRISRLKFLTVRHGNGARLDWSNSPIRPALLHLLHLPTLTRFNINDFDNFVISDLIPTSSTWISDCGSWRYFPCRFAWAFDPTKRVHSMAQNIQRYHETLHSSTSWWTADHRFWVSVQDNLDYWRWGFKGVVQALSQPS